MSNLVPKIEYEHPVDGTTTIEFDLPPEGYNNEGRTTNYKGKVSEAANGAYQTALNFTEEDKKIRYKFVTQILVDALDKFFDDHAGAGGKFKYFHDKDEVDFETYEITKNARRFKPDKDFSQGLYKFELRFRRVK